MSDKQTNNNGKDSRLPKKGSFESFCQLISQATEAETINNPDLAISLYVSAYQASLDCGQKSIENAVRGLQNAWKLALDSKNRPMAEYIFMLLEKHLDTKEMDALSADLNQLMLEKLNSLGLSLGEIADNMSLDEVMDNIKHAVDGLGENGSIDVRIQKEPTYKNPKFNSNSIAGRIEAARKASSMPSDNAPKKPQSNNKNIEGTKKPDNNDELVFRKEVIKYKDIVGYDSAIKYMQKHGLGIGADSQFNKLVQQLNKEHGLKRVAFNSPLVFKSSSRYDAKMFMEATVGEIGLPCMRMRVDENIHGANVLCVMTPNDSDFKLNPGRTGFLGRGIIALEDLDIWDLPDIDMEPSLPDDEEGFGRMLARAQGSQIKEIYNLIDVAMSDPDVLIVANITDGPENRKQVDKFFDEYELIKVDLPSDLERAAIWTTLANDHPSLRAFSTQKLVKYSDSMSRYDIEIAVHDALEEAYKQGIKQRQYVPLSIVNLIEKLAEHQDPDSSQYRTLEDAAAKDFARGLENLDDIIK